MTRLAVAATLGAIIALAAISLVVAQGGPHIQITQLECNSDPELVTIENLGDAVQQFVGWELQSGPPDSEVFELFVVGGLAAGSSISIQSGPSAGGVFKWGLEFIFRDNDPTDYARIVDDTGVVVHQVSCGAGATPTPSPTPSPEPTPTNGIPNGGGPPPPPGGLLSQAIIVLMGGSLVIAGVGIIALPWLRPRH